MAFLIASVILAVTPSPGVLYIVTRSVRAVGRYLTGGSFSGLGIYSVARD